MAEWTHSDKGTRLPKSTKISSIICVIVSNISLGIGLSHESALDPLITFWINAWLKYLHKRARNIALHSFNQSSSDFIVSFLP